MTSLRWLSARPATENLPRWVVDRHMRVAQLSYPPSHAWCQMPPNKQLQRTVERCRGRAAAELRR